MAVIVIDDIKLNVPDNKTIIEAAYENGIDIPHFCWHPELSVAGNCRMCLVEVGSHKKNQDGSFAFDEAGNPIIAYFPKLQIACGTKVTDGMYVRTKSEQAIQAQESVMEFLLINHPLDCPICDEAGQCKLQEYAFNNSNGESRFTEEKNHKPKRTSWGPNVMFDAERCISCSRCIRFSKEVAEQPVLSFVNRGDKVTIKVALDSEFDNPYSMNVIDICPVGALTSKDFRFKSRVWDMSFNESICNGCSRGCNIKIGVRNNEILRIEPHSNMNVNSHWMCDYGRLNYEHINNNRLLNPMIKSGSSLENATWEDAVKKASSILNLHKPSQVLFIASAKASNEDNYLFSKFVRSIYKASHINYIDYKNEGFADTKLKTNDQAPNTLGMLELDKGITPIKWAEVKSKVKSGDIKVLYVFDNSIANDSPLFEIINSVSVISHCTNQTKLAEHSDVVFASATFAEAEGTFTNIKKRVQHFAPALTTAENIRSMGMKMSRLDKFGAANDSWANHESRNLRTDWRIIQMLANTFGAGWKFTNSEEVFEEIVLKVHSFANMDYDKLDEYQGLVLDRANNPEPKQRVYESHFMKPE